MRQPYTIRIDSFILDDLRSRLEKTRWTNDIDNDNWQSGTNARYLKALCHYWASGFNWQNNENALNELPHFTASVGGTGIHFIHKKGRGINAVPILLIHGFPDSFTRFLKIIPLLTAADEEGFSFDLVIPSIPGFGFSQIPTLPGMNPQHIADLFTKLMTDELGYGSFFVHGGDWGSSIAGQMALDNPSYITGIHLTDIPWHHLLTTPNDTMTEAEKKYLETGRRWNQTEGGYAIIQSTKPQSLGYGLNDSPAGLAAWIIEKFYRWSDCEGNIENCFTKDELLTNCTVYWVTQTINSAIRIYYETAIAMQREKKKAPGKLQVPTALAMFPRDLVRAPREFAERIFNVHQWTEMPKGGHFAAMEQPQLLANDIRKFVKSLKTRRAPQKNEISSGK